MDAGTVKIGTCGYSYKDWLGNFYPQFCPQDDFLRFYSSQLPTVELDVTFYRIPTEKMIARWKAVTSRQFVFAAKFPKTVTHDGHISDRVQNARQFVSVMRGLGSKLGPLLLQFPYSFKPDNWDILETLVESLPSDIQLAVEIRNRNWLTDKFYDFLKVRNIALCLIDHPWMPKLSVRTADFQYIRFLGDRKKITDDFSYSRSDRTDDLDWWRNLIRSFSGEKTEIFAYFNNHYAGHAPTSVLTLRSLLDSGE